MMPEGWAGFASQEMPWQSIVPMHRELRRHV